jgi:hypothetical protein
MLTLDFDALGSSTSPYSSFNLSASARVEGLLWKLLLPHATATLILPAVKPNVMGFEMDLGTGILLWGKGAFLPYLTAVASSTDKGAYTVVEYYRDEGIAPVNMILALDLGVRGIIQGGDSDSWDFYSSHVPLFGFGGKIYAGLRFANFYGLWAIIPIQEFDVWAYATYSARELRNGTGPSSPMSGGFGFLAGIKWYIFSVEGGMSNGNLEMRIFGNIRLHFMSGNGLRSE